MMEIIEEGTNWPLVIGAGVVLLLVVVGLIALLKKRK
jgi:LPXTG-motif cell wall-anchored protein